MDAVQTDVRVVFDAGMDEPASVLVPDPHWLSLAQQGGFLPHVDAVLKIEALCRFELKNQTGEVIQARSVRLLLNEGKSHLRELNKTAPEALRWVLVSQKILNGDILHFSERAGPLTEEQALEYLIQKDIPKEVWSTFANSPKFKIVRAGSLPKSRQFRNSWSLNNV